MKLIFIGAPGAGKGTHAAFVSSRLEIPAISTGALLREEIKNRTPLGIQIAGTMDEGKLVADEIVLNIIKMRIAMPDCRKGFILDGFPRTENQARELDKIVEIDHVVSIEVPDEIIEIRLEGRRVCKTCGAIYHIVDNPPKIQNVCDKCGSGLSIRHDDIPEVVKDRLKIYHHDTEPLKVYYASCGKLKEVEGAEDVRETERRVCRAIGIEL